MADEKLIIWLIHGTWAKHADWVKDDSPLRRNIQAHVGQPIDFRPFAWSARNVDADRRTAGHQFIEEVDRVKRETVGPVRQYVIAHSHGGNIAAEVAASRPDALSGIVTLNTPFIRWLPRNLEAIIFQLISLGIAIDILGYWVTPGLLLFKFISAVVFAVVLGAVLFLARNRIGAWIERELEDDLTPLLDRLPKQRILCISAAGDEAYEWLSVLEMLIELPHLLFHRIALPLVAAVTIALHAILSWDFARPVVELYFAAITHGIAGMDPGLLAVIREANVSRLAMLVSHMRAELTGLEVAALTFLSSMLYMVLFWFLLAVVSSLTAYLVRGLAFGSGFGMSSARHALVEKLHVSLTPLVRVDSYLVMLQPESTAVLRHSEAYNDPSLHKLIGDFVESNAFDSDGW